MPIIYIHGVAVRSPSIAPRVETLLRRYIAPVVSSADPQGVMIRYVAWGEHGARFRWNRASRPTTPLFRLGSGASPNPVLIGELASTLPASEPVTSGPAGLTTGRAVGTPAKARLKDLSPRELSDLGAAIISTSTDDDPTLMSIAIDEVANDPSFARALAVATTLADEASIFDEWVTTRYKHLVKETGFVAQGGIPAWASRLGDRLQESIGRLTSMPAYVLSRIVGEMRSPINAFATDFLGDVFVYLTQERADPAKPGPITGLLLQALQAAHQEKQKRDGEPLVLLSHSMGGQVVYDTITAFLSHPAYRGLRVDFWCATASQVALFEELKLFRKSVETYSAKTTRVPVPPHEQLGVWWNVWDHNDFISYTADPVFDGVDDEEFDSGASLLSAHSAYLERPSFYRRFAEKLRDAATTGWRHP